MTWPRDVPAGTAALPDFAGRSSARTWLLSIARYTPPPCGPGGHPPRPRVSTVEDPTVERPSAAQSAVDEAVLLRTLVTELDADRREAFVLTRFWT